MGQTSATFDYVAGNVASVVTVTATFGSSSLSSDITVTAPAVGRLVINEVDYDNMSTDNAEFVEIFNAGTGPVDLTGYSLVLVNGTDGNAYKTVNLSSAGTLASGQYLVVGSSSVLATVPSGTLTVSFGSSTDYIQNGAPDGVALVNTTTSQLIDALSYEGQLQAAHLAGFASAVSLVEGSALSVGVADSNTTQGSLVRLLNGTDTDNAATDWKFSSTPTPGKANVP
jgi:hypothetical protein